MAAYGSGYYGLGVYGIGNVVISGNSSTGAVGTLLTDRSVQEDGTIATGNVGTVGLTVSVAITGNVATCAVGSVLATSTKASPAMRQPWQLAASLSLLQLT
jgi:hypothetical protein